MDGVMNESSIVKEYEFIKPEIVEIGNLLDEVINDCKMKNFDTFKCICVYNIEFRDITIKENGSLNFSQDCLKIKYKYYGLNKKVENAKCNKFEFNEKFKLIKKCSKLSNINKC